MAKIPNEAPMDTIEDIINIGVVHSPGAFCDPLLDKPIILMVLSVCDEVT